MPSFLGFILLTFVHIRPIFCLYNFIVDDQSPEIQYFSAQGAWIQIKSPDYGGGGTYMMSTDSSAYATLVFRGTDLRVASPSWPSPMTTDVSVDGGAPLTLNLQYSGNATNAVPDIAKAIRESRLVGALTNLGDGEHTAKISMASGGSAVVLDMLIYTSPTDVPKDDPACKKRLKQTFIGIGIMSGVSFILLLHVLWRLRDFLRQRRPRRPASRNTHVPPPRPPTPEQDAASVSVAGDKRAVEDGSE